MHFYDPEVELTQIGSDVFTHDVICGDMFCSNVCMIDPFRGNRSPFFTYSSAATLSRLSPSTLKSPTWNYASQKGSSKPYSTGGIGWGKLPYFEYDLKGEAKYYVAAECAVAADPMLTS